MKKLLSFIVASFFVTAALSQNTWPTTGNATLRNDNDAGARIWIENHHSGSGAFSDLVVTTGAGATAFALQKFGSNFTAGTWDGMSLSNWARFRSGTQVAGLIFTTAEGVSAPLVFGTGDRERMRIAGNGNVGIGTRNPQSRLSVNGKIEAKEIEVKVDIADYVFKDDYVLMSLEELEEFIIKNQHLPNMFSENDQMNNRDLLPLGKVTMGVLEKVEELTLHVIELNKKITMVEEENRQLRKMIGH